MNHEAAENYHAQMHANTIDPNMTQYWMRQGPKTAAFLLVIPGCAMIGYGVGMLMAVSGLLCGRMQNVFCLPLMS